MQANTAQATPAQISKLFLVGIHRYFFHSGEPAEVVGVAMVTPEEGDIPRPCFLCRFPDGTEDYVPIFNVERGKVTAKQSLDYALINQADVDADRIPAVTR